MYNKLFIQTFLLSPSYSQSNFCTMFRKTVFFIIKNEVVTLTQNASHYYYFLKTEKNKKRKNCSRELPNNKD